MLKYIIAISAVLGITSLSSFATTPPVHVWTQIITSSEYHQVYFDTPQHNLEFVTTAGTALPYSSWIKQINKFGVVVLIPKFGIPHTIKVRAGQSSSSPECDFNFDPKGPGVPNVNIIKLNGAICSYSFNVNNSVITQYLTAN